MKKKQHHLVAAYHNMLDRIKDNLAHFEGTTLTQALEHARKTALLCEEVTEQEAQNVVQFVQRDLEDAAFYLHQTGQHIKFWLGVDVDYIEDRLWQAFSQVANKTVLDQLAFEERLQRGVAYRTGEVTGIGTLQCDSCGQLLHFHRISTIPPCGKCHGEVFFRVKTVN